jgi:pSer/pThr/pTyr-binding forkhead associated (FHA) protein
MALVNFRVLQGADRGRAHCDLKLPLTIGREEGNTIQLNDERISRYHIKIQEDNQHIILTDLESTNGTRVNGIDCQLRILRFGDVIMMGRSAVLFGSREEIVGTSGEKLTSSEPLVPSEKAGEFDVTSYLEIAERRARNRPPPDLPDRLTPSQAAQLSEVIEYVHGQIGRIVAAVRIPEKASIVSVDHAIWAELMQTYGRLSQLIRKVGEPED